MKEMVAEDRRLRASGAERAKVNALVLPTARFVRPLEAVRLVVSWAVSAVPISERLP
jgi:hypothetical protein